ncbi:glutamate-5-semialdehyde dehydrogenase [Sphingobacterium spiritivorum]|uniref:glutamate-5-semialdehyde dehydrogenase n=1 Tax=Sphingobacterium spiritivorum TaxID=258 RepID=UPI003DA1E429
MISYSYSVENITSQLLAARAATQAIQHIPAEKRAQVLIQLADVLEQHVPEILEANQTDLDAMDKEDPKYDRLLLNAERIDGLCSSLREIAILEDPTGKMLSSKKLENGLLVEKKTVALGVVAVIYESRPNVSIDVAALCIRSGNVCLLRGGSDAWHTNTVLVNLIRKVLADMSVDPAVVQLLPTDRKFVTELLEATKYVDIIIPRGSQSLIDFVRNHAKVPVIETGAGVCHTYVETTADLDKAAAIVANAKISRPSVCNALDTVLVDREIANTFLPRLVAAFSKAEVEVFADNTAYEVLKNEHYPFLKHAEESDFGREFLDLKCSIKVLDNTEEALDHIALYSSRHSECIISNDAEKIERFMNSVDAAAVYANASTRFTDGGEFGLGAEIGISTQKLHARGPFALEKLVTEKWFVTGDGQIR